MTDVAKGALEAHAAQSAHITSARGIPDAPEAQRFISSVWGWPSGWNIYWIIFFSAALTLLLPLLARVLSRTFRHRENLSGPGKNERFAQANEKLATAIQKQRAQEAETFIGRKILIRSLTSVTLALFFFSLVLLLGPLVGLLQPDAGSSIVLRTFFCILSVTLLGLVAVVYATRKGNTWWSNSRKERFDS